MDLTKNNRGKKNIFMCFRSVGLNAGGSAHRSRKGSLSKSLSDNNLVDLSENDAASNCLGRKEKPRRRLSRVLKAILFDASLSKRIGDRKPPLNRSGSQNNLSSIQTNSNISNRELLSESDDMSKINSSGSSSRYSSTNNLTSMCPNCSCSIPNSPERMGSSGTKSQEKKSVMKFGRYLCSNRGLCLLLSCFMVLIIWGKVCAICCTLTWLLFAPRRLNVVDSLVKVFDSPDIDSDKYKKRVIMEGLLDRSNNNSEGTENSNSKR
ncbi:hypothetical protein LguiB_030111 [Lonicera macranthoides]